MKRRTFLATTSGIGVCAGLSGCLGMDLSTTPLQNPESFDQCPRWRIRVDNLPDAARSEVETALEEGLYEAAPPLYLPNVLDPQSSYLITTDPLIYYRAKTDREGDVVRLTVDRAVPTKGQHEFVVSNNTGTELDLELLIDFIEPAVSYAEVETPKRVLTESFSIDPDTSVETAAFERLYGRYKATVVIDDYTETVEYRERHIYVGSTEGIGLSMDEDEFTVNVHDAPIRDDINCSDYW